MVAIIPVDTSVGSTLPGWTVITSGVDVTNKVGLAVYGKIADAADVATSSYRFWGGDYAIAASILAFENGSLDDIEYSLVYNSSWGTSPVNFTPGITPPADETYIIQSFHASKRTYSYSNYGITNLNPSWTELVDIATNHSVDHMWSVAIAERATTTATGDFYVSNSGTTPRPGYGLILSIPGYTPPPEPEPVGVIQDISFYYDDGGNIVRVKDDSQTFANKDTLYWYDDLYRLTAASSTSATSTPFKHSFGYTPIGNLATSTLGGTYVYGEMGYTNPHAPTSVGGTSLSYDNSGNLTARGSVSYEWDYRNRLISSETGSTITYGYDHTTERVFKATGSATTTYANDLFTTDGTTVTKHIYAGGELVATVETSGATTTTHYSHADHLGSTNVVTDTAGDVVQTLDYYPYGAKRIDTGTDVSQREFIGQIEDPETSMNYLNARYFENGRGQFISQDPMFWALPSVLLLDPQQQNSYSYARNNPIGMSDPSGQLTVIVPGTNYSKKTWSEKGRAKDFIASVGKTFNEPPIVLDWSGGNTKKARKEAVAKLADLVGGSDFAEGEKLNIVGHSHGGNIAIQYSQSSNRQIDNLVTLGTPVRSDYQPNYDMIGTHINAYSNLDLAQFGGGQAFARGGVGIQVSPLGPSYGFIPAGRIFSGASNIGVTAETFAINPIKLHSNLWMNPGVWSKISNEF